MRRKALQVDVDGFVVAVAFASTVVTGVLDRAILRLQLAEPDEIERLIVAVQDDAGGIEIDLDASCIILDGNYEPLDLVWFRQLQSQDGSIKHSGDNRTGEGDGDDETIYVDLQRLPSQAQHLVFTVNSFTGQNFSKVENAYCRILNEANNKEIVRFNLSEKGNHTGIVMASLSKGANGWTFKAIGQTTSGRTVDDLVNLAVQAVRA